MDDGGDIEEEREVEWKKGNESEKREREIERMEGRTGEIRPRRD